MYEAQLMYNVHVHVHAVTIRRRALILHYMTKFKAELINANTTFKNERRILIGYWLAQQLLAVRDVLCDVLCDVLYIYNVCMHALCNVCGIKQGQSLGALIGHHLK